MKIQSCISKKWSKHHANHRHLKSIHRECGRKFRIRHFSRPSLTDNPEVSSRLTNLSMRHAGTRPAWFNQETLKLPGRIRQCKRMFWQIVDSHQASRKSLIALLGKPGMGKTSFLSELHALLEHAPETVLTLAPGTPDKTVPFKAIRNILEQRFYISTEAQLHDIQRFVKGAVSSIIAPDKAEAIVDGLMLLWSESVTNPTATDIPSEESTLIKSSDAFTSQPETCRPLKDALEQLLSADLAHNSMVVILDDIEYYDAESIQILKDLYENLSNHPFTMILTASDIANIPIPFLSLDLDEIELQALSDQDLTTLTRHLTEELFKDELESPDIPDEICHLIAQRSFGSPQRARDLTMNYIRTDGFNDWPAISEKLRHEMPPDKLGRNIVNRFKNCSEAERLILKSAAQLDAPFTVSTIESIVLSCPELPLGAELHCGQILKKLYSDNFLEKTEPIFGANTTTYVFKHECERLLIAEGANAQFKHHIYGAAAQWYTLNNPGHRYDENIGDLFNRHGSVQDASIFYIRVAYQYYRSSDYTRAWPLFRKLISCMSEETSLARRIQFTLDGADVAFHLGQIDDAFLLCRRASHHALKLYAYAHAARANIQLALMLLELGNVRHMGRYLSRAQILLNRENTPEDRCNLCIVYARQALWYHRIPNAVKWLQKAQNIISENDLSLPYKLSIELVNAQIDIYLKTPAIAIRKLQDIIEVANQHKEIRFCASAYQILGNLYQLSNDLAGALESWNLALGMSQKMNHVILNAKLLADISDGAFELKAIKTARAASEQCLQMAQQTHQKLLIARCMQHTALLHFHNGQINKAVRLLKKAHKSAVALKNIHYWFQTLTMLARCYASPNYTANNPNKAKRIYQHLFSALNYHKMPIQKVHILIQYTDFLKDNQRFSEALETSIQAGTICQNLGLEKAYDRVKKEIDGLLHMQSPNAV